MEILEFLKHKAAQSERKLVLERNDFLVKQGDINTSIFWIESGTFRIYTIDNEEERNTRFGYSNNIIVALDAYFSGKSTQFYIQAIKKAVVVAIPKNEFLNLLNESQHALKEWNLMLEDLVLQQLEREQDLLTSSPRERYERVRKRSPQLFQEIPERHIANYLRMSPETLSRLKKS